MDNTKADNTNIQTGAADEELQPGTDPQLDACVRMALDRMNAPEPDVDSEWRTFSRDNGIGTGRRVMAVVRPLMYAVAGAAAMFLLLFFFHDSVFTTRTIALETFTGKPAQTQRAAAGRHIRASRGAATNSADSRQQEAEPFIAARRQGDAGLMQHVATNSGMDLSMKLSDGTEIWLNAGSSIDFPSSFQGPERRVRLSGEAYFKVAHNERKPFIVSTDRMSVRVLGTEFNFKSYSAEPQSVTLIGGSVEVSRSAGSAPVATLRPGEEATLGNNDDRIFIQQADTYAATQWVKGYFYFKDKPLVTVLRDLGRWYNLGVVFKDPSLVNCNVHFSALRSAPVSAAIESLNRLNRFKVKVEGGNIVVE